MRRSVLVAFWICTIPLALGCQPGHRYEGRTPAGLPAFAVAPNSTAQEKPSEVKLPPPTPPEKVPADVGWIMALNPPADIPIVFISSDRDEWPKLKDFWNYNEAAKRVEIRVPLGLDDPTGHIPAANPPTVKKWALGKRLFLDEDYLSASEKISCAACHLPAHFYTAIPDTARAPLMDSTRRSWSTSSTNPSSSGTAGPFLEEVVQRTLEDERPPPAGVVRPHVWSGVIDRLGSQAGWVKQFEDTFGVRKPTQDMVGKARRDLSADRSHRQLAA